jgi:sugar lactone lactonase YvrE
VVADVGHFDFQWTAEHKELVPEQFPDANPYGVISSPWSTWVVDAGANTLDRVSPDGSVSVTTFFPNPPVSDAVPTCIDRGRDGAFYVGELTGGGNKPGASVVWRVVPGQAPTVWASGLTAVTGCGFGTDGQFYAVEFSTLGLDKAAPETGAVVRVPANSTSPTPIVSKLSFPNGFAAGWDRALYVSNWSVAPANSGGGPTGEVLRIAFQGHED